MPLVIVTGLPSSGKTRRTKELCNHFQSNEKIKKCLVVDDDETGNKNFIYTGRKTVNYAIISYIYVFKAVIF